MKILVKVKIALVVDHDGTVYTQAYNEDSDMLHFSMASGEIFESEAYRLPEWAKAFGYSYSIRTYTVEARL